MSSQSPVSPKLLEHLLHRHGAALELFASQWTPWPEDCVQEPFVYRVDGGKAVLESAGPAGLPKSAFANRYILTLHRAAP